MTARIRPADDLIAPAVAETVNALQLEPEDAAAVQLARRYAAILDDAYATDDEAKVWNDLGPKLLAVLESLGATPRARALAAKGGATRAESRLAAIRSARGA